MTDAAARAERLLRWYPAVWRARYGEEFTWLLEDDLRERPSCLRRDADVVRAGLSARLGAMGVGAAPVVDERAAVLTRIALLSVFVAAALSIWTQLANAAISATATAPVLGALVTLSAVGLVALATAGVALRRFAVAFRRTGLWQRRAALLPVATIAVASGVLMVGAAAVARHWPGRTVHHSSGLAAVVRVTWAATDSISTYWPHPGRLATLSAAELTWMVVSPVAVVAIVLGIARLRRLVSPAAAPSHPRASATHLAFAALTRRRSGCSPRSTPQTQAVGPARSTSC
jgi:hypothetical protein